MSKPTYEELEAQFKQLAAANQQLRDENLKSTSALYDVVAENAALKSKGRELLGEACAVYAKLNKLIDPAIGDFIDGQTLHEFQFVLDVETKETDAFLASLRAEGVDTLAENIIEQWKKTPFGSTEHALLSAQATYARKFAAQLRSQSEQVKGVQS